MYMGGCIIFLMDSVDDAGRHCGWYNLIMMIMWCDIYFMYIFNDPDDAKCTVFFLFCHIFNGFFFFFWGGGGGGGGGGGWLGLFLWWCDR